MLLSVTMSQQAPHTHLLYNGIQGKSLPLGKLKVA